MSTILPSPLSRPPPVGRDRELALLRERLTAARDGRGSVALISGEAGIGKTTLADALCREAADVGAHVLTGHCFDRTETPPYGPWIQIARRVQALSNIANTLPVPRLDGATRCRFSSSPPIAARTSTGDIRSPRSSRSWCGRHRRNGSACARSIPRRHAHWCGHATRSRRQKFIASPRT